MTSPLRRVLGLARQIRIETDPRIIIIGAGASGIAMAHALRHAGIENFVIFEKAASIGGTWRDNTYPGIACDVPPYLYSYTFFPNPYWSQSAAPGDEIREYLVNAARHFGLLEHIRFNCEVNQCVYADGKWTVTLAGSQEETADIVISCAGFLHHPNYPVFQGMETFSGEIIHSARWNHRVTLKEKRVALIGSGSTSVQIVSAIVADVRALKVFQRTPQWVLPNPKEIYAEHHKTQLAQSPDKYFQLYDEQLAAMDGSYGSVTVGDPEQTALFVKLCQDFLATVKDPELRRKLTPNYRLLCKRLVMSADFYEAIQHPNCELVTERIERLEPSGIRVNGGVLHEVDIIVFATGYRAREFFKSVHPRGEGGVTLEDVWANGVRSFESVALAKFPNFFMLGGPFSTVGNQSFISCAELQASYVVRLIKMMEDNHAKALVPKDDSEERFCQENASSVKNTPWMSGCQSWYLDGTGNFPYWSRHPNAFVDLMSKGPRIDDYRLLY